MTVLRTPPYRASGIWELITPWKARGTTVYTCIAIRNFNELLLQQEDIYSLYYFPKGLSYSVFESDKAAGASLITLLSEDGEKIFVPDSFIKSYPMVNLADYKHVILSASLGALPASSDLTQLKQRVTDVIKTVSGINAVVQTHIAPTSLLINVDQAKKVERVRQSQITDRNTSYANLSVLEKRYSDMSAAYVQLKTHAQSLQTKLNELTSSGNTDQALTEQIRTLEAKLAKATADNTKLKADHARQLATEKQKWESQKNEEVYRLNTRIRELEEQLAAQRNSQEIGSFGAATYADEIRSGGIAKHTTSADKAKELKQSVGAQLAKQSGG